MGLRVRVQVMNRPEAARVVGVLTGTVRRRRNLSLILRIDTGFRIDGAIALRTRYDWFVTTLAGNPLPSTVSPVPATPPPRFRTAAEWHASLGNVPLSRIRFDPLPGTATASDVTRLAEGGEKLLVELVNGTLVEKPVGLRESIIAGILITVLNNFVRPRRLGFVSGEQGTIRMLLGNLRIPDVAFFLRADMPDGRLPADRVRRIAPALAIEVLSESSTDEEMQIKVREYFQSGTRLVWLLDPRTETLRVYDDPGAADHFSQLASGDALSAPGLLPGFSVRVGDLFDVEGWEG